MTQSNQSQSQIKFCINCKHNSPFSFIWRPSSLLNDSDKNRYCARRGPETDIVTGTQYPKNNTLCERERYPISWWEKIFIQLKLLERRCGKEGYYFEPRNYKE